VKSSKSGPTTPQKKRIQIEAHIVDEESKSPVKDNNSWFEDHGYFK